MGLPPEPSKTCSFRKCNIPLFTIVWKKIFKVQQMPKNKEKKSMKTCTLVFIDYHAMSIQKIWKGRLQVIYLKVHISFFLHK